MAAAPDDIDRFDVAVVGAGAAGLWTALCAAEAGGSVCLVSRKPLAESASFWAQGGLAAVLEPGDSADQHAADTIAAGRGLCRPSAVEVLVAEAPGLVAELRSRGVRFDLDPGGEPALGLEGGHTHRRIVHAGGSETGRELTARLAGMVAARTPDIEVREETSALALWSDGRRCAGVLTDRGDILAAATVMATGGAAALWSRTTNPWGAIGAGPVLAGAAGADLADLEFCQFHPTALAMPGTPFDGRLITEAVRGEGATLLDASGERFTAELEPRDAVTADILERMRAEGSDHVVLDLRGVDPGRFPNVFATLREAGLDPLREPGPGRPGRPLRDGRDRRRSRRALLARRALRGRRVLLHRPARRQPAGLELAQRVLRVRQAGRPRGRRRARPAATAASRPSWRFDPPTEETREAVWRLAGPLRRPAGARGAAR